MPKGEFENRDRDEATGLSGIPLAGIGELPEDLADERGDRRTYNLDTSAADQPDLARAADARESAGRTGLGSPVLDYTVRSVYDSRPNSSRDFNQWYTSASSNPNHLENNFAGLRQCFFVPQGYVAVVRKLSFRMDPTTDMGSPNGDNARGAWYDALVRLLVNGATVDPEVFESGPQGGASVPVRFAGIPMRDGDDVETWAIADEGFSIGVQISGFQTGTGQTVANQPHINVGFYGNLLLKTGRPAMFEPANLAGRVPSAVTASARDLSGIPSGDNLVARQRRKNIPFANVPLLRKP